MKINATNVPITRYRTNVLSLFMKTFIILFCSISFGFSPKPLLSQNIQINKNQELSVIEVFELIKKKTDYRFVYKTNDFVNAPKVQLVRGVITVQDLLSKTLSDKDYFYVVTPNRTILLKKKDDVGNAFVQQTISGTVVDKNQIPLAGATVAVYNANNEFIRGSVSDFDGTYNIQATAGDILKISYIGFDTQSIVIGQQTTINIVLAEQTNILDEVLLNTGYQTISKERATGSFEKINSKTLGIKTAQNVYAKIEGEAAGVLFDNVDGPVIRGLSTINSINDPLIVVDGFPIEQGLETINPNDVESITILKDAAAASIWGIRAANGVIVIVTKKGNKNNKPSINYSTNYTITRETDLHDQPYAPTSSFLEFEKHAADNGWRTLPSLFNAASISKGLNTYLLLNSGAITEAEANAIINNLKTIDSRGEFEDLFMADQTWMQHNFSIGGGGDNNSYHASLAYNQNRNINSFQNNDSDQIIANISNQIDLSSKLSFTGRINYSHNKISPNGLSLADAQGLDQYQNILDENGNYISQPQGFYDEFKEARSVENGYPYDWSYNLMQEFENKDNRTNDSQIRLQAALKYDITNSLSIEGQYQYENSNSKTKNLSNENTFLVRNSVNTFTTSSAGTINSAIPKGSFLFLQNMNQESHSGRIQLNFNKSLSDGMHDLSGLAGYEVRQVLMNSFQDRLYGYDDQSLNFTNNINFNDPFRVVPFGLRRISNFKQIAEDEDRFISYYGNIAYTYAKKYTLTGSVRLDDTNLFGASDKYKNIPLFSLGGRWSLHNEDFFSSEFINTLALRATYGSNGNANNTTSPFVQAGIGRNPFNRNEYAFISNVKNPELRLEKVFVTNIGLDFGLLNNRISGYIEYYERNSEDLLSDVIFPSTLGFNSALINAGEMENKGFDLSLTVEAIQTKSFNYTSTLNLGHNKNAVTKVDVPENTPFAYTIARTPLLDKPLRYLYSYQYAGLNENGDPTFLDENGDQVNEDIDVVEALKYEGTTTPKFYGGWINQFNYKNFTLRALTTFKFGHVFRNTNFLDYSTLPFTFGGNHYIHEDFQQRWQNPGDEETTDIPRIPTTRVDATLSMYADYYRYGSQHVDTASHIRLREVILSYAFNESLLNHTGIDQASLSLQATNLALINFNKWNVDPESIIFGNVPTFTLGLNINF